ncbi:hypothetical protein IT575_15625 [bacterium]|nr:hypothetical protein [bacterium]
MIASRTTLMRMRPDLVRWLVLMTVLLLGFPHFCGCVNSGNRMPVNWPEQSIWMPPGAVRAAIRSRTFEASAYQHNGYVVDGYKNSFATYYSIAYVGPTDWKNVSEHYARCSAEAGFKLKEDESWAGGPTHMETYLNSNKYTRLLITHDSSTGYGELTIMIVDPEKLRSKDSWTK